LPKDITIDERKKVLLNHIDLLKKNEGEKKAILLIRVHLSKYFYGIKNHKKFIKEIMLETTIKNIKMIIEKIN
jgi:tRNA-dihydrouridine synthase